MGGWGQWERCGGRGAARVSFNGVPVGGTARDSEGGWRELLAGAGVRSAAISGSGVFRDAGTDERARQLFFDGLTPDFQIVIPSFGIIEGPFQVAAIEYGGSLNGEATYELSLQSAGQLSFTADTTDAPVGGV